MKRLFKLGISVAVGLGDGLAAISTRLAGFTPTPRGVVLYYHGVSTDQRARFARQMEALVGSTQVVPADALDQLAPRTTGCAVTFDDGFESVLVNALPELERRGVPATLFVPTGCLGQRPSWITRPSSPAFRETVMSERQLAALKDHPLVTIGSHTVRHPRLPELEDDVLAWELRQSKADLERITGREVSLLSCPHGAYDARVLALALQAGYRRVFTIAPRCAPGARDAFVVGRVAAAPEDWELEFRLKFAGAYRWLARRQEVRGMGRPLRPQPGTVS